MNFIGMGPMEIGVILVVALIIFGPGKLPEVAGQVGKAVRDFRRMTSDLTDEFEKTSGVKDIKRTIQDEITGVKRELDSAAKTVNTKVSSATSSASRKTTSAKSTTAKSTTSTAKTSSTTGAKASASSKASATSSKSAAKAPPVATKADPLADVSFFEDASPVSGNGAKGANSARAGAETSRSDASDWAVISNGADDDSAEALNPMTPGDALSRARRRRQTAGYNRTNS